MTEGTTQLSGLSDYELELEGIIDRIIAAKSTLMRINILKWYIENRLIDQECIKQHNDCL